MSLILIYGYSLASVYSQQGDFMKAQMMSPKFLKLALLALTAALLSSCGNTKSNPTNTASAVDPFGAKLLATCNKTKDTNFSINTSNVNDTTTGQISADWIKMKFNFLSTANTATGNTIKFFKWRVLGASPELDNTPLIFAKYDISTGQTSGTSVSAMTVSELSATTGLYIQLNDPNAQYQVLKAVVYNSSNQIVSQINTLIPGFYASPIDYQSNADGTPRTITLQQMHALYGTSTTGWTALQMQQYFSQYCF